jgi:hypothetical protein
MLLVNTNLRHDAFPLPQLTGLEATAVCLQLHNHSQLIFVSAYLPLAATIAQTDLDAIFSLHDAVILAGDLNCKHVSWNNASENKNGSTLLSYCLNHAITINYPNQPTHFPYNSYPSVLDIALSQRCTTSKPLCIPALSSDHNPIVFKVHLHSDLSTPRLLYDYRYANWPLFRSSLDLALDPHPTIQNTIELDHAITTFTQTIRQAAAQAIPVHATRHNHLTLPPSLLYQWKLKNYYRRRYQRTRLPSNNHLYHLFARVFSTQLTRHRNSKWPSLNSLWPQTTQFWKIERYFTKSPPSIPPLIHQGDQVYLSSHKAEVLAQQFERSHHLTLNLGTPHHSTKITRFVDRFFQGTTPHTPPHEHLQNQTQNNLSKTSGSTRR